MREILFRGKCIDETCLKGKWIEGYILHDEVTGKYYIYANNCLNESDIVGEEGLLRFVAYEVDPETVCQYTGLTDKAGKKIFEGDILAAHLDDQHPEDITYVQITWDGFSWCVRESTEDDVMSEWDCNTFEVCGNIFDNPELVK